MGIKKTHLIKLIDGNFTPSEGGKVLRDLLTCKINYHQLELFSNQERFAKDSARSKSRIRSLKTARESLKNIIECSKAENCTLQINGTISIVMVKKTD